jgi:serine/threonine protein kinase
LSYLKEVSLVDVKHYMYILLDSVDHLAECGVMHRDIKPNNFLFDPKTRTGLLIDFGLSEVIVDSETNKPKKLLDDKLVKKIVDL